MFNFSYSQSQLTFFHYNAKRIIIIDWCMSNERDLFDNITFFKEIKICTAIFVHSCKNCWADKRSNIMKHHNRQGDLHYHLRQLPEMRLYMYVCRSLVYISYPTNFQINLTFICFILPLQVSFTVLQNLTHCKAS